MNALKKPYPEGYHLVHTAPMLLIFKKPIDEGHMGRFIKYSFFVNAPGKLCDYGDYWNSSPVAVVRWAKFLEAQDRNFHGWLGSIKYRIDWTERALSLDYHPKKGLGNDQYMRKLIGASYFVEYFTTCDLMLNERVKYVTTTQNPSPKRRKQLERVYLDYGKLVPINEWVDKMRRGVRNIAWLAADGFRRDKESERQVRLREYWGCEREIIL